jgi:hypothetical protein
MLRRALVVGIDRYDNFGTLSYAEHDAAAIARRLRYDDDDTANDNFAVKLLLSSKRRMTRAGLREAIHELFAESAGLDLVFYFAGHGFISDVGGYLVTADGEHRDCGISMDELIVPAHASPANSVLIMLDCCHAGAAGNVHDINAANPRALLRENMTIVAASLPMQQAFEAASGGLFSAALRDALDGAAADVMGEITVSSVYSVIEKRFSLWQQRPVVKSYVTRPVVLRRVKARLSRPELRRIVELFPAADYRYPMEPAHDPERNVRGEASTPEIPDKVEIGRLFKRYRDAGLLKATVPGEDLYYVAQRSHTVELTLFGKEYWRHVEGRV